MTAMHCVVLIVLTFTTLQFLIIAFISLREEKLVLALATKCTVKLADHNDFT